jgi:hypothetical protein
MSSHRLPLLGILGAFALAAAPSGAEILNTTSKTQAKNFSKGAEVEKFDDLQAGQFSSYDPNQTTVEAATFSSRDGATRPTFHSGGGSPNDPVGNPGTPIAIVDPTGAIEGDTASGQNAAGPLVVNELIVWSNGFMEVIFPEGQEAAKVGFWVTHGSVNLSLRDRNGSELTTGDFSAVGNEGFFVGVTREAADVAVAAFVANGVDAFTIDDFTYSASAGPSTSATGSYDAKLSCREVAGGVATKTKREAVIEVLESEELVSFRIADVADTILGHQAKNGAKPGASSIFGLECNLNNGDLVGAALTVDATVKPNGKASLKGTLTEVDEGTDLVRTCNVVAKRTSTVAPEIQVCP